MVNLSLKFLREEEFKCYCDRKKILLWVDGTTDL